MSYFVNIAGTSAVAIFTAMGIGACMQGTFKIARPCSEDSDNRCDATQKLGPPHYSLAAGTYAGTQSLILSSDVVTAKIYYTNDGSTPTEASALFESAITLDKTQTIRAVAVHPKLATSEIASNEYVISPLGTVSITNLHEGRPVETGFVFGTVSKDATAKVGCQFDGGDITEATVVTDGAWKCPLPTISKPWRKNTSHVVTAGLLSDAQLWTTHTVTVIKNENKDVNGDGYPDLIVGAHQYNNGAANDGAIYMFYGSASGVAATTVGVPTIAGVPNAQSLFGYALTLGDFNGDNYADAAVGAYAYNNGAVQDGGVYVYYGSSNGLVAPTTAGVPHFLGTASAVAAYGSRLHASDLNEDGYSDVLIGAHRFNNGTGYAGAMYLLNGSASGAVITNSGAPIIRGQTGQDGSFGSAFATADLNNDGHLDLVVGAASYRNPTVQDGALYIYNLNGGAITPFIAGAPTALGISAGTNNFGNDVEAADVNADGYMDIIVSAAGYNNGAANDGGFYVMYGSALGYTTGQMATPTVRGKASGQSKLSFPGLGDINNDGIIDLVVGSPTYDNGTVNTGGVYAFYGAKTGIPIGSVNNPDLAPPNNTFGSYGRAVLIRDLNADGSPEVIIGSPTRIVTLNADGALDIRSTSANGLPTGVATTLHILGKPSGQSQFGFIVQ